MFNMLLYFAEIFAKRVRNGGEKSVHQKNPSSQNVCFFHSPKTYFLGFLPWLKLDLQIYNSQKLASIVQFTNKFHLIKYLFSYFLKFSIKCQMQCCIARNFSWKLLDEMNVNVEKFLLQHITDFELVLPLKNSKKFKLNRSLFFSDNSWKIHVFLNIYIYIYWKTGYVW